MMTSLGNAEIVANPIDLLGDADPGVRLRAVLEVGEERDAKAAGPLVERFGLERDFQIREALTWAVLRIADVALPLVRDALSSPRWLTRLQAVHTLSKLGRHEDGPRLLPLIADPIDSVAARAYWAAGQTGNPVAIPALVAELARGDSEHRNSLAVALSMFGSAATPPLVGALHHEAPAVRRHAASILGLMGSPDADAAVPALAEAVEDPVEAVRIAALNALGQLAVPEAWWVVDEAAHGTGHRLRHLANRLLERRPRGLQFQPLITCEGGAVADELRPVLALQIRVERPRYLSRQDVPAADLDRIRNEALEQARRDGRPELMAARIAAGHVEQFVHQTVLLEQVSVANPGALVKDLLIGRGIRIIDFARLHPDDAVSPE